MTHYFLTITFCIYRDFLFFADVSIQISAVSSTFSATDHKHALLICFDTFSSMFLILNNSWKFKMESESLGISKHASRITLIAPIQHQITQKH